MTQHELVVAKVGIDTIKPHPDNPRKGDVGALAESLERFGQVKPIIVQESTGYVVAGNHTREAAKSLGWEEIAAVVLDLDDDTAKAYLLADNRLADKGEYDADKLYELLASSLDLDGTGYDLDYVETLGDAVGANVATSADTGPVIKQKAEETPEVPPKNGAAAKPKEKAAPVEPMRDIVLLMTVSAAAEFGRKVGALQKAYGSARVVDTVVRAVDEACEANGVAK